MQLSIIKEGCQTSVAHEKPQNINPSFREVEHQVECYRVALLAVAIVPFDTNFTFSHLILRNVALRFVALDTAKELTCNHTPDKYYAVFV